MTDIACGAASARARKSIKRKLFDIGIVGLLGTGMLAAASVAQAANTGITQVVVQKSGTAFAGCSIGTAGTFSYYEGYALDVIDPSNPLNTVITDIQNAQKDSNGYVDVLFNFYIILPTNLANFSGKIVADIPNRSSKTFGPPDRNPVAGVNGATSSVSTNDPAAYSAAPGSGNCTALQNTFFWGQGWATVDAGWEADPGTDPTSATLSTSLLATGLNAGMSAVGVQGGNTTTPLTMMPIAVGSGNATLTGPGYEYIVEGANTSSYNLGGGLTTSNYPAASSNANSLGGPCSTASPNVLTWRHHLDDTPAVLPAADWQFNIGADGNCDSISLTAAAVTAGYAIGVGQTVGVSTCTSSPTGACFFSQDIYELSYTAANPTVNGAGHALIRDFYSWLKGNSGSASQTLNPFVTGSTNTIKDIYSWTSSQPARTINDYLHLGFNGDLAGKRVFDGMVNWIGAGAGISMNYRWSHTTETERNRQQHLWVESFFPFADATTTDPISGLTDGRYVKCTANNTCPLMNMNQYSANEYWVKTASLLHTDPTGTFDLTDAMHPLSRYYYMSSLQHGGGTQSSKTSTGVCQNYNNPINAEFTERAMFADLDQYITNNIAPPPSAIPTLAGGTLVTPDALNFPSGYMQTVAGINGGSPFPVIYTGLETTRYRFNFGPNFYSTGVPTYNPPINSSGEQVSLSPPFENNRQIGPIYPSYVPATNSDGNDITGVRMPEVQVPLATYAGWNYRSGSPNAPTPQNDGPDGCESTGSYIQFAATTAIQNANGDPRPSITTRYPTYAIYLNDNVAALNSLVAQRLFLCGYDITGPLSTGSGGGEMANLVSDWTSISGLPSTNGLQPSAVPECNKAHDFNGDGYSDILWRDTSGDVALWLMNGAIVSQSSGVGTASPSVWSIVGQRDFNGDGKADILWQDTSGDVAIWYMNGSTVTQSSYIGTAPTTWSIAGTGNFFGDANADILWRDTSGDVAIWEISGGAVINSCGVGNAPTTWSIVGTGDFNGDGKTDILWHDTSGDVAIWEMNGCSIVQSAGVGTVPTTWSIAGTGDFNGDRKSDILWHDTSGDVAVWLMNGATILQSSYVGTASPSVWSIAQTGDYYGTGMSDILWHDTSGDVAVWEMNGATITKSSFIGTGAAPIWTIQSAGAD